ncbi:TldE protein, part of TldE/TldD proteolytic complex [Lachnospiraceae bacterium KM106-2]|nr:TldE protein, part of TldE/TldD proteolytic complex [Lachnospiraceae bacterium KM106-2]
MEKLKQITDQTIEALTKAGADEAQCIVADAKVQEFNVDGGEFSLYRTLFDQSISMTVLKNHKKGETTINHFDKESIESAATDCINVALSGHSDGAFAIGGEPGTHTFTTGCIEPDVDRLFERIVELMDTVKQEYPLISIGEMVVQHKMTHSLYQNTKGSVYEHLNGTYIFELVYSAHDGDATSSISSVAVLTDDLDTPFIKLGSVAHDLKDAQEQIYTKPIQGKFTGVAVFTPACLMEMLYYLTNNSLSDSVLINQTSVWKDKLNEKVADEKLSIELAPLDPRIRGGERYTTDGAISKNYTLIDHGILKSFMLSLYGANKTGFTPAKNDSFNIIIEAGDTPFEDMIKKIDHGIIVGGFSGGMPAINGEFSGVAKNSFLIENGKISKALSETMINGNLNEMVKQIVAISKEVVEDGHSVLPYVACDGIVISGK